MNDNLARETVLIGSAGAGSAFAAATAIRRAWGTTVKIVAMDINPGHLVTTSLLADQFEMVPLSSSPLFLERLQTIVTNFNVTTYLPLVPHEIAVAADAKETRSWMTDVKVMAPPANIAAICMDKDKLCQLLIRNKVPVPATYAIDQIPAGQTVFVKPKDGFGSRGARMLTYEEASTLDSDQKHGLIAQELCVAPEVTIDSFYDSGSDYIRTLCRERIEVKSGVATKCRIFDNDELEYLGRNIAKALNIDGSFCFQVMRNQKGEWAVTDVNPRPGAGTSMCTTTGNDFFAASFARCWQIDYFPYFRKLTNEVYVTRQYSDFLTGQVS